jgi:hypothetical protein
MLYDTNEEVDTQKVYAVKHQNSGINLCLSFNVKQVIKAIKH